MTFNQNLINKFLDAIFPLPKNFGITVSSYEEEANDSIIEFETNVHAVDSEASVRWGISKIVIISPKLKDIVIKIPFNGYYDEGYEVVHWNNFIWATGSDSKDYCLAEYEKYKKLKIYNLDCFVAKTWYYKTIDGVRVFLQEKAISINDSCNNDNIKPSKKSQDLADKWYEEDKFGINPEWIAICLDRYGKSRVERFLYYCENIDSDILEDAHCGNYGYRANGTPCVIDYSNFAD